MATGDPVSSISLIVIKLDAIVREQSDRKAISVNIPGNTTELPTSQVEV